MGNKVVVVGAGPGGLTAAMLLASRGYDVEVFEKQARVGGRNALLEMDGFRFDTGPTFLMMPEVLEEVFSESGRRLGDYLDIKPLDPLYRLVFGDGKSVAPTLDRAAMRDQIESLFPGEGAAYDRYLAREKQKLVRLMPCLQVPYTKVSDLTSRRILRALPLLDLHQNLFDELGRYFRDPTLRLSFTFQAKYLGMSPWKCPGTFSIISYLEHSTGIHHPIGGLNAISLAMAKVVSEEGGRVHCSQPVDQVLVQHGRAVGVRLCSGDRVDADHVVVNADFGHAVKNLFAREDLHRWTPKTLDRKSFSCSTFMLYLGTDRTWELGHHTVFFAPDYRKNVREISEEFVLSEDPSIYVQNACRTDPGLAPEGCSTLYVLVPIANNRSHIEWDSIKGRYREKVLDLLETRAGLTNLRKHIVAERMITPLDWERHSCVHEGATFNLAHSIDQMLYFRPHNEFDDIRHCFLVGGGTHPGSGLPTIYESGRIAARLILQRDGA
jgi:phytoene desaturase